MSFPSGITINRYLSFMARIFLDKNNEFIVKEWKAMNIVIGVVFTLLFVFAGANFFGLGKTLVVLLIICIPGFFIIFRKGRRADRIIFRINDQGIYYYGTLITNWDDFHNAYVIDGTRVGSYRDNFELVIEFYRDEMLIRRKIGLTNTQDKSEEEVYTAVMYFYKQHSAGHVETVDVQATIVQ